MYGILDEFTSCGEKGARLEYPCIVQLVNEDVMREIKEECEGTNKDCEIVVKTEKVNEITERLNEIKNIR